MLPLVWELPSQAGQKQEQELGLVLLGCLHRDIRDREQLQGLVAQLHSHTSQNHSPEGVQVPLRAD